MAGDLSHNTVHFLLPVKHSVRFRKAVRFREPLYASSGSTLSLTLLRSHGSHGISVCRKFVVYCVIIFYRYSKGKVS